MTLSPVGHQGNEGVLQKLLHKVLGGGGGHPIWYQLDSGATSALDVGAAPGTSATLSNHPAQRMPNRLETSFMAKTRAEFTDILMRRKVLTPEKLKQIQKMLQEGEDGND